jgi:hypothetical protein
MPGWSRRATASASRRARSEAARSAGRHLDRHRAVEPLVVRGVDRAEAAGAEPLAQAVATHDERGVAGGRRDGLALLRGLHGAHFPRAAQDPLRRPRTLTGGDAAGPPSILAFFRQLGVSDVSFFDEDDEPTRRSTRPGRSRSGGAATTDRQTVLIRQAILVGGVLLFALILFFLVRGCASDARKRGLRDYNQNAGRIITESDRQIAKPFFDLLNDAKGQSPADLQSTISGYRNEADQEFKSAQNLSVPDQMVGAQRSLSWRSSSSGVTGLTEIASRITAALSDDAEASTLRSPRSRAR